MLPSTTWETVCADRTTHSHADDGSNRCDRVLIHDNDLPKSACCLSWFGAARTSIVASARIYPRLGAQAGPERCARKAVLAPKSPVHVGHVGSDRASVLRLVWTLTFSALLVLLASCSPGEPVRPDSTPSTVTPPAETPTEDPSTAEQGEEPQASETAEVQEPTAEPAVSTPRLRVGEDEVVEIVDLAQAEQLVDAQGNLVTVYGIAAWPDAFEALPGTSRTRFDFVSGYSGLNDTTIDLVALDIGMCAAGIDATGFGTVEFYAHDDPTVAISKDPVRNRAVNTDQPIAEAAFSLPAPATCDRGWLPVFSNTGEAPTTARYVLTNRPTSSSPIERHVYQWDLSGFDVGASDDASSSVEDGDPFDMGQTVTFNEGLIKGTSVTVTGWAELVGTASEDEGTRTVAVLVSFCPSSAQLPEFGLAVDGWNLIAPVSVLGDADPATSCAEGWLPFDVPFGAAPTGFFATDGANVETGYAYWSLEGAALPAPEE